MIGHEEPTAEGLTDARMEPCWVLTNDDGVEAPGLRALAEAVGIVGARFRVVAPAGAWSGKGHGVTTHEPIGVARVAEGWTAVAGSPADSVRLALASLATGASWVLAGINAGGNLGADVHYSGTVAAAREAALNGRSAIALSHYLARGRPVDWSRAARWAAEVLARLTAEPTPPGTFWNVNLPHPADDLVATPELVVCPLDPSPLPLAYREVAGGLEYCGNYQTRPRVAGADVERCFGGAITATLVSVGPPIPDPAAGLVGGRPPIA